MGTTKYIELGIHALTIDKGVDVQTQLQKKAEENQEQAINLSPGQYEITITSIGDRINTTTLGVLVYEDRTALVCGETNTKDAPFITGIPQKQNYFGLGTKTSEGDITVRGILYHTPDTLVKSGV